MNQTLLLVTGMVRMIVYVIIGTMAVACIRRNTCKDRILHIGDLVFVIVSMCSFLSQNLFGISIGEATVYVFTPALFFWALSRIIYFHKR